MTKEEYGKLVAEINRHMELYYNQDAPEISDFEYDMMMKSLKEAEAENPQWVTDNSPTRRIGGNAMEKAGTKIVHNVPMLSIEDVFDFEAVEEWVHKVKAVYPDAKFSVETKIDGLSCTLRYRKSSQNKMSLYLAETRGDGYSGENCYKNVLMINDVSKEVSLPYDYLEVRGEVYMTHESFENFNRRQEESGGKTAENPRNLAAGTLRQLDPKITADRNLSMFIFNIQDGPAELISAHTEGLDALSQAGFKCVFHRLCSDSEEVIDAIKEIGDMREILPYDIDGAVVKIDQIQYRPSFPTSAKYTPGHIAYKYPPEEKAVIMEDIEVTVGRTGKLGFVGHVSDAQTGKPVRLCGTSVSRVTLHNRDYIKDNKIGIGGIYLLKKSGDIIPKLCGLVKEPTSIFDIPSVCPVCGEPIVNDTDTAEVRCVNPVCSSQLSRTISYFTSLNCMNIIGLGETLVTSLVEKGYLKDYADIYCLKERREELISEGIIGKEKNTDKILAEIEKSKENDAFRLLAALGIRNVGLSTARTLLNDFSSIESVAEASVEELTAVNDIGETTAECIYEFFRSRTGSQLFEKLRAYGLKTKSEHENRNMPLSGLTFVVTGTLPSMGRKEIENLIADNGGKSSGSVSKKTDYLVAGENAGSKLTKAQELGVKIISEPEFLDMIKS